MLQKCLSCTIPRKKLPWNCCLGARHSISKLPFQFFKFKSKRDYIKQPKHSAAAVRFDHTEFVKKGQVRLVTLSDKCNFRVSLIVAVACQRKWDDPLNYYYYSIITTIVLQYYHINYSTTLYIGHKRPPCILFRNSFGTICRENCSHQMTESILQPLLWTIPRRLKPSQSSLLFSISSQPFSAATLGSIDLSQTLWWNNQYSEFKEFTFALALQSTSTHNPASTILFVHHPDQPMPGPRESVSSEKCSPMSMKLHQLFDPLNWGSVSFQLVE